MKKYISHLILSLWFASAAFCSLHANETIEENFCFDADVPEAQDNLNAMCLTAPTLFCPATYLGCPDDNLDPSNTGTPIAQPGDASCPMPIVTFTDVVVQDDPCLKIVHRTWRAEYPQGTASIKLHSSCQQTLFLEDEAAPVILNCPNDITLDLTVSCDSTAVWTVPTAEDDCSLLYFITDHFSGESFPTGTTSVTYEAKDRCGRESTCTFNVNVIGTCCVEPTITCPPAFTTCPVTGDIAPNNAGMATAIPSHPSCGAPLITFSDTVINSPDCTDASTITRLWTASDASDGTYMSSCTQTIDIIDDIHPILSNIPSDITVTGNGSNCVIPVIWTEPTATDNCGIASVSTTHTNGSSFPQGTTSVEYIALDNCGNSATAAFNVTVNCVCDAQPFLACPPDFNGCVTGVFPEPSSTGFATAIAGDNICGIPVITYSDNIISNGPCAAEFEIERTWIASDPNNPALLSTCTQDISVSDNDVPVFTNIPSDITLNGKGEHCLIPVTWSEPSVTDDCGIATSVSSVANGTTLGQGVTNVVFTATDFCGNMTTASFNVTIECTQCPAPLLTCPSNFSVCPGGFLPGPAVSGMATVAPPPAGCPSPIIFHTDALTGFGNCQGSFVANRTWTAFDPFNPGQTTSCVQVIRVDDNTGPEFTSIPSDIIVTGSGNGCLVPVTWELPVATDNCGMGSLTSNIGQGTQFSQGTTPIVYTATDNCGNTTTASFNVTVICEGCSTIPTIACPSNFAGCPSTTVPQPSISGTAIGTAGSFDCAAPVVTFVDAGKTFGSCAGAVELERIWTATDPMDSNLSSSCIQLISLDDNTSPVLSNVPQNITVTGNGTGCVIPVSWQQPTVTDNCGAVSLTSDYAIGSAFQAGLTTVTYTATDNCGNVTTATFNITVICNAICDAPPSVTCPANYVSCISPATPQPSIAGSATAINTNPICTTTPTISFTDVIVNTGACLGSKTINRTWTAFNQSNLSASCIQVIELNDTQPPVFTFVPQDIVVSGVGGGCQVPVTWQQPTATDNCGIDRIESSINSGITFSQGTTVITLTAYDNCGNSTVATFNLTVQCSQATCTVPPSISCPANYVGCPQTGNPSPSISGNAIATITGANCSGIANVSFIDLNSNSIACAGSKDIQRTWTATNPANGLISSCIQTISLGDTQNPVISGLPQDIFVTGNGNGCQIPVTWTEPTATDNCGLSFFESNISSGTLFTNGTTTITYTAADNCGNQVQQSFNVTVNCQGCVTAPSITCPANFVACPQSGVPQPNITGTAIATNNGSFCNGAPSLSFTDVVANSIFCAGSKTVERIWTASDATTSLSSSCIQVIRLEDNTNPTISGLPQNIFVTGNGNGCQIPVTWTEPTATDNCGLSFFESNISSGSLFGQGNTVVTYTASDNCGNQVQGSFTVNVTCQGCSVPPSISCPSNFVGCPSVGGVPLPGVSGQATAIAGSGLCSTPAVTFNDSFVNNGNCPGEKTFQRIWTATDPSNGQLSTSCVQIISLQDNQAPVFASCPSTITLLGTPMTGSGSSGCIAIATWNIPIVNDNCSSTTVQASDSSGNIVHSGSQFLQGVNTVTYTATDACGNAATCAFDIIVQCPAVCNAPPVFTSCPADASLCIGANTSPTVLGSAIASGGANCVTPVVTYLDQVLSTGPCAGQKIIQRVWRAAYPGNSQLVSTCTQTISVGPGNIGIQNCPSNITTSNGSSVTWTVPTLVNPCSGGTLTSSHAPGSVFGFGTTVVTYTGTDACGNSTQCSFTVTVTGTSGGFATCPDDIILTCGSNGGTIADWDVPVFESSCNSCSNGAVIPGFVYMGSFGGSQFYCSINTAQWPAAKAVCEANGGFLADVNSQEENDFLSNFLESQSAWIGLVDVNLRNEFEWCNGEQLDYTNWFPGQPNNFNNSQPYVEMLSNGQWNDQYSTYALEYIMEIPCTFVTQTQGPAPGTLLSGGQYSVAYEVTDACGTQATCSFNITVQESLTIECPADIVLSAPTGSSVVAEWETPTANSCCTNCNSGNGSIPGFVYMGSFGGSEYYCSIQGANWLTANSICQVNGGNLVTVNSQAENDFLANNIPLQSAWIGYTDFQAESNFYWADGSKPSYTNWYPGQPNNYNKAQHFVEMLNNGQWNDQYGSVALEFIMEISSCVNVTQTQGIASGSSFQAGTTTTITYRATDGCGNVQECSFNVVVEEEAATQTYCPTGGNTSTLHFIDSCQFGDINNVSGDDFGYADYTTYCTTNLPGQVVPIKLIPGFGGGKAHKVYWTVWIDYNQDGDFYDNLEFVAYGCGTNAMSGNVTMPINIPGGQTTMRISMKLGGYATDPCEQYTYGESEDYCVVISSNTNPKELILGARVHQGSNDAIELSGEESTKPVDIKMYPNPVSELLTVEISNYEEIESMALYNIEGRKIETINRIDSKIQVDVSRYAPGMYHMQIENSNGEVETERFVIQR